MKDYISELKELKRISDINHEVMMLTYTPQYVSLMMEETGKICKSKQNKDKFMRFIDKCFKMFANDDFEYMLPVLTTVTLNVLTRTMKKEVDGSNKPTNEPTSEMFG